MAAFGWMFFFPTVVIFSGFFSFYFPGLLQKLSISKPPTMLNGGGFPHTGFFFNEEFGCPVATVDLRSASSEEVIKQRISEVLGSPFSLEKSLTTRMTYPKYVEEMVLILENVPEAALDSPILQSLAVNVPRLAVLPCIENENSVPLIESAKKSGAKNMVDLLNREFSLGDHSLFLESDKLAAEALVEKRLLNKRGGFFELTENIALTHNFYKKAKENRSSSIFGEVMQIIDLANQQRGLPPNQPFRIIPCGN
jgi:hypothetical protein